MKVRYLTTEQIALIHSFVIEESGGRHGIRDYGAVLAVVDLPRQAVFGKELYQNYFTKAAVYARHIILNHPFVDGNKRTGMTAACVFLENNGYRCSAEEGEIEHFALEVVRKKLTVEQIADWLKKRV